MKAKYNWKIVVLSETYLDIEQYMAKGRPSNVKNSNRVTCTICSDGEHKMRIQFRACSRKECQQNCETKYALSSCLSKSKYQLAVVNEHENVEQKDNEQSIRGLNLTAKEAIETILNEKNT